MTKILLTCLVLCDAAPVTTVQVETNNITFQTDVQLLRMGWYNYATGGRCKALRIKYETKGARQ